MSNLPPNFKWIVEKYGVMPKPILFNTEMTKAILDGRKVMTRRVIKGNPRVDKVGHWLCDGANWGTNGYGRPVTRNFIKWKAKYQIDDILWVREPARVIDFCFDNSCDNICIDIEYKADKKQAYTELPKRLQNCDEPPKWVLDYQGIPNGCIKEMARIFLKVTNVRVERLQDINDEDIKREGLDDDPRIVNCEIEGSMTSPKVKREEWIILWNSTAPKGYKWEDNPYVFVYEFERIER